METLETTTKSQDECQEPNTDNNLETQATSLAPTSWKMRQFFSTAENDEADAVVDDGDMITAAEFSCEGEFVALGDKGGRVWVYCTEMGRRNVRPCDHTVGYDQPDEGGDTDNSLMDFYGQFQSHEPEFDYLKSLEIDEKINAIRWLPRTNGSLNILSTNDKTVKLWKIFEKPIRKPLFSKIPTPDNLTIPKMATSEILTAAIPRRTYANAHAYHINSIDLNSDCQTLMSSDDLRINLWDIEKGSNSWTIVDLKPENMEDLDECITSAKFHPTSCNLLAYTTGMGKCYLADLRLNAKVGAPLRVFSGATKTGVGFFTDITDQMSCVDFSHDGAKLITRAYTTAKIWDQRFERAPLASINMQGHSNRFDQMYENEVIFDKFQLSSSRNSPSFVTGGYGGQFSVVDWGPACNDGDAVSEVISTVPPKPKPDPPSPPNPNGENMDIDTNTASYVYHGKVVITSWNPRKDVLGVAVGSRLYLYEKPPMFST